MKLQAAIKYAEDDMKACVVNIFFILTRFKLMLIIYGLLLKEYVDRSPSDDAAMEVNKACILFKVRV